MNIIKVKKKLVFCEAIFNKWLNLEALFLHPFNIGAWT